MSELSADEARRAAEWLEGIGWPESARELRKYADPPETVESLRAELAAEREELVIAQGMASDVRAALENWQRRAVAAEEDRVSLNVELTEARDDAHEQRAYLAHYRRKGVADDAELARLRATPTLTPGGELQQCLGGAYRVPPSPEECFEDVAEAQLAALVEAGYLVVHESDTDEGRAAAQVDPGGKHDAWLEARSGPHD